MQEFADDYELLRADFDMCCFGLKAADRKSVKGAHVILTNLYNLQDDLHGKTCAGGTIMPMLRSPVLESWLPSRQGS